MLDALRGRRGVGLLCLGMLVLLLIGVRPAAGADMTAVDDGDIGGVPFDELVSDLSDDGVAVVGGSSTEPTALAQVVSEARSAGLHLSVVSTGTQLTKNDAQALADQLVPVIGGTVLVLSPSNGGRQSDELSQTQLNDAAAAVVSAGSDDVAAARAFSESATAKPFPWSLVIIGGIILLVVVTIGAGVWERRRKHRAGQEELAELTAGLARKVGTFAPLILRISERVELAQRPDLEDKFNAASGEYNALREQLRQPLPNRGRVDDAAAQIATLAKRLGEIDQQLDTALPGL